MIYSRTTASLLLAFAIGVFASASDGVAQEQATKSTSSVVLASEAEWTQLNPPRGDASPQAATLWGARAGTQAMGFLVKFVDGFSSPPHIHNVTYRGVVIGSTWFRNRSVIQRLHDRRLVNDQSHDHDTVKACSILW
ncbi:DUF4437 domain-containing protein [Novipirellula rosea]|uniref:Uncharacterized protein n=1 Tax=Novipirellula rosea TaxID=1031540 RepID=A0ABP8MLW7_9BACT